MHNKSNEMQNYNYSIKFEDSPLGSLSTKAQFGIVGGVVGVFALVVTDAALSLQEWVLLPEIGVIALTALGARYYMKKNNINLMEQLKNLNWDALIPGCEPPVVEGTIVQEEEEEEGQPKEADESELDLELVAEDCLFLSNSLRPHANAVFSNRVAILGIPGAGKSNTVAVFAEELGRFGAPLVIFDTENEYGPLCTGRYFKRPFIADRYSVNLETAFSFGEQIMEERLQVVLNLDSYDDDDLAALIMIDVIRGIQKWEEALSNDDRIPCAIILDEAAVWLPQNPKDSMLSKTEDDEGRTTLEKLQQIFFSVVVRRGRKRGIGFILASQRSAEIDKRAIASAQWKFLQEQNMPNDLKVYHEFGVEKEIVQALGPGQAFVLGPGVKGVHQLRKRNSPDNAKTPGLESLRKRRYTEGLAARAAEMRTPVTEPVQAAQQPARPSGGIQSQLERTAQKYQKAREAWENGATSIRKLMPVMGLNFNQTRDLVDEMHRKGLIDKYEKSRSGNEESV